MAKTPAHQASLFDLPPVAPAHLPDGFVYRREFVDAEAEAALAAWLGTLPFRAFEFRGYEGRRQVVSFGWQYDFNRSHLLKADDIPGELLPLRAAAAALAGHAPADLQQVLINKYEPGAPIGWHRDRPVFAEVVGISLLAPCVFRLRRRTPAGFERASLTLEPRSAYLLSGAARTEWEHSIPPVGQLRYSITFRNFRS
ncbi:alpha-ketoglutarate-dependent dioxygenase AlkB [Phenylobacterium soli]|uniref:Alpha-ketoglutarate-dependent dioxygenase AlkB n=1 Tax=Phenylobacterium soli TaxID=2170551 RepID=A0A328AH64_9CAUL|nr:alpha-ketoglutarate-dependent dioxygenase AlkB [Phenylobacterium soli]RAK53845.1 alpha-ketoglutarate-dependent dioxygenase AlkB [Phenylobacterium soli]